MDIVHGTSISKYMIPCICHVYVGHLHIHGIYQAYSRHIPKIGVPDEGPRGAGRAEVLAGAAAQALRLVGRSILYHWPAGCPGKGGHGPS